MPLRGKAAGLGLEPGTIKDPLQCLYTVRFSPNAAAPTRNNSRPIHGPSHVAASSKGDDSAARVWMAYGGAAGFVRCQRIGVSAAKGV